MGVQGTSDHKIVITISHSVIHYIYPHVSPTDL